jgi:hypothetical protein
MPLRKRPKNWRQYCRHNRNPVNLGHAKGPEDTCKKTGFGRTLKKAANIGNAIAQCGGTRAENKMLYRSVWKPAVEYTLQQSFLSKGGVSIIVTFWVTCRGGARYLATRKILKN